VAEITLQAAIRKSTGRSASGKSRRSGIVPGIYYLHNDKNVAIEVDELDLRHIIYTSETHIVNLELDDGSNLKCILRDVQFDPVTDKVVHFDLMGLVMGERMRVEVPIRLEGSSPGVHEGGVLNHIIHKVELDCLPSQLPEHISVDVSKMEIGDMITIGQLEVENVNFHHEPELPVVMVAHGRVEAEPTVEEEEGELEESAEPEVIGKGQEEDEGD